MITLSINGAPRQIEAGTFLDRLLLDMALSGKRIAIERNGEIVPRSQYPQVQLLDGDQLEIVVAVGGG